MGEDSDNSHLFSRRNFFKLTTGLAITSCHPFSPHQNDSKQLFVTDDIRLDLEKTYEKYEFSLNENPLGASPKLRKLSLSPTDLNRYEFLYANYELLITKHSSLLSVAPDFIRLGPGSTELLHRSLKREGIKNKNLAVSLYDWPKYIRLARKYGWSPSLTKYNNYKHDLEALKEASKKASLIYLTNPNLPFANRYSPKELLNFIEDISKETLIIIDECYLQYTGENWHEQSLASYTKTYPNLIVSQTFSKFYGLGSARLGAFICSPEAYKKFNIREPEVLDVSVYPVLAAITSLDDREHQKNTRDYALECIKEYYHFFKEHNCTFIMGETNYGALLLNKSSSLIRKYLVEKMGYRNYPRMTTPYLLVSAARKEHRQHYLNGLLSGLKETGYL